jgi:hypothetical protein
MSAPNLDQPANMESANLPRRDWLLLLLLSVSTIAVLVVFLIKTANRTFPQPDADIYLCVTGNSQAAHLRGIPNVVCSGRDRDTPVTEYRLNNCGHRSAAECRTKSRSIRKEYIIAELCWNSLNLFSRIRRPVNAVAGTRLALN